MENKRIQRTERIYAYVPTKIKESIVLYKAKEKISESEVINLALKNFFNQKANDDSINLIIALLRKVIKEELGGKFERQIALTAKSTKLNYSEMFLLAYLLSYIFNSDDEKEFLKEKIELAQKLGYNATKSSFGEDISKIIPKDLDFDKL